MNATALFPVNNLMHGLSWRRIGSNAAIAITVAVLLCVPGMSMAAFPRFLVASAVFTAALTLALTVAGNLRPAKVSPLLLNLSAVAAACVVGVVILSKLQGMDLLRQLTHSAGRQGVASTLAIGLAIGAAMAFMMALRERQAGDHARHEARERLLERQVLESQLKLLQAQVEPHFLFNTLAHVQRLVAIDAPAALALLDNLSQYLRAALPDMRERQSTVGREADMAQAYLGIMRTRMGERLRFSIDIPGPLRSAEFPPMMLLSLVENAVQHGVGDAADGLISITAQAERGSLTLQVSDNGRGFDPRSAQGIGLANIRDRLQALYGPAARLSLEERAPGEPQTGVTASIVIPQ
jgi:signal transduction histidine kinase